jgi:hypothetical protein
MQARAEQHHELVWIRKKIGDQAWNDSAAKGRAPGFRFTPLELGRWDQAVKGRRRQADCVIAFVRCRADVQAVASAVLSAVVEDGLLSIDETWTGFRFRPKHLVGKRPR